MSDNLDKGVGCQGFLPSGYYGRAIRSRKRLAYSSASASRTDRGSWPSLPLSSPHTDSVSSLVQPQVEAGGRADIMLMTHAAPFGNMTAALAELGKLYCVCERPILMRVEPFDRPD